VSDIATDVLVVGGGMCGVLVAHRLKEAGVRVILVEARTVGGGITKNTTAKITAQHGLVYADLIKQLGVEGARRHYEVNAWAVGQFRSLAERFVCDFEDRSAYVYSVDDKRKLEREATVYRKLGIEPIFQENPPLPFGVAGAVGMVGQAQFHPLEFLYALADGLEIYENTFVIGSPRCSHMGCKLRKNTIEGTWDCPCHGSRFDKSGHVINNPAKKGVRL